MEYRYSTTVDPLTYATDGLCDGISLRLHQDQSVEDFGAIKAQEDWRKYVAPLPFTKASLGPMYNFLSVAFPETLPGRMEILAYFNEFIFLHDDVVECVDKAKGDSQNDEAMGACQVMSTMCSFNSNKNTGRQKMVTKVAKEMLAIDMGPASETLTLWRKWFDRGAGRQNHTPFNTLAEYQEYRILDVGEMYLTGVATFGMGLTIPDDEQELRSQLCRPAWIALGLTNDIYSIEKEREAATENGERHVCNAVWVIMRELSITEDEAKSLCRQKIQDNVAQYMKTVEQVRNREDLSRDLRIFVEAIQYVLSGNIVWTLGAPRYNPKATYNERQLDWMAHGTPMTFEKVLPEKQKLTRIRLSRTLEAIGAGVRTSLRTLCARVLTGVGGLQR